MRTCGSGARRTGRCVSSSRAISGLTASAGRCPFRSGSGPVSVEREFGMDEGELALDVRFAPEAGDPASHLREVVTYGESALVRSGPGRSTCEFLWVSGEEPFLSPKGQWNGVRMRIVP